MSNNKVLLALLLGPAAIALTGCGNPEQAMSTAIADAETDWREALAETDAAKRVKSFDAVIAGLEEASRDYAETPAGQAIAGGRAVGNVSLPALKSARDALAARAACYSAPTAECLKPFGYNAMTGGRANASPGETLLADAQSAVCERGFAAADKALEPFKINRPVYAQQLIQIAFAAEECGKPAEVRAAIDAFRAAEPSTGAARIETLLGVAVTDELRAGWPSVLAELETLAAAPGLDNGTKASLALTMASSYAALGDTAKALAKYKFFTDDLRYAADLSSRRDLAASLVVGGAADAAIAMMQGDGRGLTSNMLYTAAEEVASRLKLVDKGSPMPRTVLVKDVAVYFAPPANPRDYAAPLDAIEKALDGFAPGTEMRDGIGNLERAYGVIAISHQKIGAADRAAAAMKKAQDLLARYNAQGQTQSISSYQALLGLARGATDEVAALVPSLPVPQDYVRMLLRETAKKGNVEQSLTMVGQVGNIVGNQATPLVIETLIETGELDKAEQVINAYAGNVYEKEALQWQLVTQAANDGSPQRAQAAADKYGLIKQPADKLRLLTLFLNNEEVARDRADAEPIIREIFTIGQELDRAGANASFLDRSTTFYAQEAAAHAFRNGHIDLGIELYRAAANKDQRPLFQAFKPGLSERDLKAVLLLAHDNLSGEQLGYVIDAAVRHLEG